MEEFIRCGKLVKRKPKWTDGEVSYRGYRRCTAQKTHGKGRCRQPAVKGKDKCKWHGGATPVKTGLYSKYIKTTLGDAIVEASSDALADEVRLSRAVLSRVLEVVSGLGDQLKDKPGTELGMLHAVREGLDTVRQMVESHSRVIEKRSITPEQVEVVVRGLLGVLSRYVDNETMMKIAQEMKEIPWPASVNVSVRPELVAS